MVIDTDAERCAWYRTAYDVAKVQQQMEDVGLPDRLVQRLSYGL
jgi:hypothetical protein